MMKIIAYYKARHYKEKKYSYTLGNLKNGKFCVEIGKIENLESLLVKNGVGNPDEDAFDQYNESSSQNILKESSLIAPARKIIEEKPARLLKKKDEKSHRVLKSAAMSKPVNEKVRDQDSDNNDQIFFADADSVTLFGGEFLDDVSEESVSLLSPADSSVNEDMRD